MRISEISEFVNACIVTGNHDDSIEFEKAFSCDLLSDVLTLDHGNFLLITGLSNLQAIRTAELAGIKAIVLVRGKVANSEMIELANENHIVLMQTEFSMFKVSGILFSKGLKPVF